MTNKQRTVGNEIHAGSQPLQPVLQRANRAVVANFETMRSRRRQLIRLAAEPPGLPVLAVLAPVVAKHPAYNQFAYSVLLISLLGLIAVATSFINWAFLVYGLLAVLVRLPSNQMFVAGLVSLVIVPLTTILQRGALASDFSVMTFYFLVIGLVRASLELRHHNKTATGNGSK